MKVRFRIQLQIFVVALLFVVCTFGTLAAQSIQMSDIPGWDGYQAASRDMQTMRSPSPSGLHWATSESKLYFSIAGEDGKQKRMQVNLMTGDVSLAEDEPKRSEDEKAGGGRRRGGVARARQRVSIKSEDGKWKASYRDNNIQLESLNKDGEVAGDAISVTTTGTEKHRFGTACWVYGEELYQQDAMWFSPDSGKLAFYEIDESHMKTYFLTTRNTQLYTNLHKEQYPTAGQDNPHVALHIYDLESKMTVKVNVEGPVDQYIFNVRFSPAGDELLFNRTNRWQNVLDVMAASVDSGNVRTIVTEEQKTWQNNLPLMNFLDDGQRFVWETERTGWKQYELRNINGDKICDLTPDTGYPVHAVVQVDEENGWFYYSAYSDDNPLNLQLHRSQLDGSQNARLTAAPFNHSSFKISPDNDWFSATYETVSCPPSSGVWNMNGDQVATMYSADETTVTSAGFVPAEQFSFPSMDGKATIYGTLYKPRDFDPAKKYPLLIDVYGGPHSVGVTNRFSRGANANCELGFLIAKIGNRGTVNRGKEFEEATYLKLGILDLDDQAAGVKYLAEREYVDGDRVGIYGHSYGGYMSALALLRYPDVFHAGVAGAPVTNWKNYDTIYTERYMRTPQKNKPGYEAGSCMKFVENLKGKLFILHGLVDDNVHPSNTWQLVDALQKAGKRFDMMIYPNNAHGFRYNELKWEYLVRHLKPEPGSMNDKSKDD